MTEPPETAADQRDHHRIETEMGVHQVEVAVGKEPPHPGRPTGHVEQSPREPLTWPKQNHVVRRRQR
ncbi:hypothetical protein DMH04_28595 [Kibdelosporangium aridum]|uniref:Uncharacterized protein n=1 Tax=Kibdelosporangium aridum TaxID=2030 RepID=A0A428Z3V3_KIBAR|nr:hypothetical protein [Kibdelosporangium aridum]RSM80882.1 hypothetical protein DMH04_28595 [Kibdelosporangium aridum]